MAKRQPTSATRTTSPSKKDQKPNPNETPFIDVKDLPWRVVRRLVPVADNCDSDTVACRSGLSDADAQEANVEAGRRQPMYDARHVHFSTDLPFDTQVFAWKWSPDGRYGVDSSGGRHSIHNDSKKVLAFFDLHDMSWRHYDTDGIIFYEPRFAFLYWVSAHVLVAVTLVYTKGDDPNNNNVPIVFHQFILEVDHPKSRVKVIDCVEYKTRETIDYNLWFHAFNDRCGEPFVTHDGEKYLVFSNTKNCLVLIPYAPRPDQPVLYVRIDVNGYLRRALKKSGLASHDDFCLVPFAYGEKVHLFVKCTPMLGGMPTMKLTIRLADFLAQPPTDEETSRDLHEYTLPYGEFVSVTEVDMPNAGLGMAVATQEGRRVVLADGALDKCDEDEVNRLQTVVADWQRRCVDCKKLVVVLDLATGQAQQLFIDLIPSDVLSPHPSGSILMFRYKEMYGMQVTALCTFAPLSLNIRAQQRFYSLLTNQQRALMGLPEIRPSVATSTLMRDQTANERVRRKLACVVDESQKACKAVHRRREGSTSRRRRSVVAR